MEFKSKGHAWLSLANHAAMLYQKDHKKNDKPKATEHEAGFQGCFATLHDAEISAASEPIFKAISRHLKDPDASLSFPQRLALLELSLLIASEHPQFEWSDIHAQVTDILRHM